MFTGKLKFPIWWFVLLISIIVSLTVVTLLSRNEIIDKEIGTFFSLIIFLQATFTNLIQLLISKNKWFLIPISLYFVTFSAYLLTILEMEKTVPFLAIPAIPLILIIIYVSITKKIFPRNRKIFEIAALKVIDNLDGYTERSFSFDKLKLEKGEIISFAKYLNRHLITRSVINESGVYLFLGTNEFIFFNIKNPVIQNTSHVFINFDGSIIVNIIKKDYNKFKNKLTFDKLCNSFGELFLKLAMLFTNDKNKEIVNYIDDFNFKYSSFIYRRKHEEIHYNNCINNSSNGGFIRAER